MQPIAAEGETYGWNRDITEQWARTMWFKQPPGATVVAVDDDGSVLGTAEMHPNQGGGGSHVANAGFMVNPATGRRGVGRALGEYILQRARDNGFRAMQFNAVVSSNVHAVRLWQSLGFDILATVPQGFHHPDLGYVDLYIMYRTL
jgi:GNAT superfamily N-acetyltransferase